MKSIFCFKPYSDLNRNLKFNSFNSVSGFALEKELHIECPNDKSFKSSFDRLYMTDMNSKDLYVDGISSMTRFLLSGRNCNVVMASSQMNNNCSFIEGSDDAPGLLNLLACDLDNIIKKGNMNISMVLTWVAFPPHQSSTFAKNVESVDILECMRLQQELQCVEDVAEFLQNAKDSRMSCDAVLQIPNILDNSIFKSFLIQENSPAMPYPSGSTELIIDQVNNLKHILSSARHSFTQFHGSSASLGHSLLQIKLIPADLSVEFPFEDVNPTFSILSVNSKQSMISRIDDDFSVYQNDSEVIKKHISIPNWIESLHEVIQMYTASQDPGSSKALNSIDSLIHSGGLLGLVLVSLCFCSSSSFSRTLIACLNLQSEPFTLSNQNSSTIHKNSLNSFHKGEKRRISTASGEVLKLNSSLRNTSILLQNIISHKHLLHNMAVSSIDEKVAHANFPKKKYSQPSQFFGFPCSSVSGSPCHSQYNPSNYIPSRQLNQQHAQPFQHTNVDHVVEQTSTTHSFNNTNKPQNEIETFSKSTETDSLLQRVFGSQTDFITCQVSKGVGTSFDELYGGRNNHVQTMTDLTMFDVNKAEIMIENLNKKLSDTCQMLDEANSCRESALVAAEETRKAAESSESLIFQLTKRLNIAEEDLKSITKKNYEVESALQIKLQKLSEAFEENQSLLKQTEHKLKEQTVLREAEKQAHEIALNVAEARIMNSTRDHQEKQLLEQRVAVLCQELALLKEQKSLERSIAESESALVPDRRSDPQPLTFNSDLNSNKKNKPVPIPTINASCNLSRAPLKLTRPISPKLSVSLSSQSRSQRSETSLVITKPSKPTAARKSQKAPQTDNETWGHRHLATSMNNQDVGELWSDDDEFGYDMGESSASDDIWKSNFSTKYPEQNQNQDWIQKLKSPGVLNYSKVYANDNLGAIGLLGSAAKALRDQLETQS